jgi:hypothetical protein
MKLTKANAARQLGISRTTLYKLIEQGTLSATPDGFIDSTELVRAAPAVDTLKERTQTPMYVTPLDMALPSDAHLEPPMDTAHARPWTDVHARQQASTAEALLDMFREQVQIMRAELREAREEARQREARASEREALLLRMLHESQQRYDRLLEAPRPLPQVEPPPAGAIREPLTPVSTPAAAVPEPAPGLVDETTRMPAYLNVARNCLECSQRIVKQAISASCGRKNLGLLTMRNNVIIIP